MSRVKFTVGFGEEMGLKSKTFQSPFQSLLLDIGIAFPVESESVPWCLETRVSVLCPLGGALAPSCVQET